MYIYLKNEQTTSTMFIIYIYYQKGNTKYIITSKQKNVKSYKTDYICATTTTKKTQLK